MKTALYDQSPDELSRLIEGWNERPFRARQIYHQLYVKQAASVNEMTDLPKALRERLDNETLMGPLRLERVVLGDGGLTRKAVFLLPNGSAVEAVLMIYPERATVCVSSQAGCAMGCTFCATGKNGLLGNLSPGAMNQQVLWAAAEIPRASRTFDPARASRLRVDADVFPRRLTNVVYMGMGEPFNNYDNWWASVQRLHDPDGFNMGARSFTVSTVGIIPGIKRLAAEPLPVNLAISLHYASDAKRSLTMPVNKKYGVGPLIEAAREYTHLTRRRVSFEYILLEDENDRPEAATALADLLSEGGRHMLCHINLIPWNPVRDTAFSRSSRVRVNAFKAVLEQRGIPVSIRIQRGIDIDAACGQLAGKVAGKGSGRSF